MTLDRYIEIILGVMTLAIGFTSFWLATKSTRIQSGAAVKAVDAEAFERAKEIYESALTAVREELVETRKDLSSTRVELADTRNELIAARKEVTALRHDIEILQEQLDAHQARDRRSQGGQGP